jgi:hypothetical protein
VAAEHTQPLLQRVLSRLPQVRSLAGPITLATGLPVDSLVPVPAGYRATPDDLGVLIQAAIHEVARTGRAVIVAHAASMALTGVEGVLRVLVTASVETRALRLATSQGLSAAEAAAALAASDRERGNYLSRFYQVRNELPTHYDAVINSDVLTPEEAVRVILSVCRRPIAMMPWLTADY